LFTSQKHTKSDQDVNYQERMACSMHSKDLGGDIEAQTTRRIQPVPEMTVNNVSRSVRRRKRVVSIINDFCPVVILTSQGNDQVAMDAMKTEAWEYVGCAEDHPLSQGDNSCGEQPRQGT